jgi:tetratricopeptide (TPR) repeat protein
MTKPSIRAIYNKVVETQRFEDLSPFIDQQKWDTLTADERIILANLFIMQGEQELEEGALGPLVCFDSAQQLSGNAHPILLKQARLYMQYAQSEENLWLAKQTCEEILAIYPQCTQTRMLSASCLVDLSILLEDPVLLEEAHDLYQELHDEQPNAEPALFWYWGVCIHQMAKESGEAADFTRAIAKYQLAEDAGYDKALFFNDFANALVDLSCLINQDQMLVRASQLYQKVVDQAPDYFEGWFNLACTDSHLWALKGEERHFYSAHKSFDNAASIDGEDVALWMKWASLLADTGKSKGNSKLLEASLDKYTKANNLKPDYPPILMRWAETQIFLGVFEERLDYLKWAEVMIKRALEIDPENVQCWVIYGRCLLEIGRYFEDASFYCEAIEKIRYALSIDRSIPDLWHTLALAHHLLGRLQEDAGLIEQSLKYYAHVPEFGGEMFPDFWNEWGVTLMKMGELQPDERWIQGAAEKFEFAIRLHHQHFGTSGINVDWLYNYGCALDFLGDLCQDERYYEKAIKVLSQATTLDPDHTQAKLHLALAYSHLAEAVSEVECFERALNLFEELAKDNPEDDLAFTEWALAIMHLVELIQDPAHQIYVERMLKDAEEKLSRAISLGNESANYYMACLQAWTGNFSQAMHFIERAESQGTLPSLEEIIQDEWLKDLRTTSGFQQFLTRLGHSG